MIGVLSGFGAVNCPFAYFQFISMNSIYTCNLSQVGVGCQEGNHQQYILPNQGNREGGNQNSIVGLLA